MKSTYQSIYYQYIINNNLPNIDTYLFNNSTKNIIPNDNFVLCRNQKGEATAIYGKMTWNFKPYATSKNASYIFNFNFFNDSAVLENSENLSIIHDIKKTLFLLLYFLPDAGRTGTISVKILGNRFQILKSIALYAKNTQNKLSQDNITLRDILSNEMLLIGYINTLSEHKKSELSNLLENLQRVDPKHLGYELVQYHKARPNSQQTSIIPFRIYLQTFSILKEEVDRFWTIKDNLTRLIKEFTNKDVGNKKITQEKQGKINHFQPELTTLIIKHKLNDFFQGDYSLKDKRTLITVLINIQITCKYYIHQYTAMRDNEVLQIRYQCINKIDLNTKKKEQLNALLPKRFINVISSTTKLAGYHQKVGWLAPEAINKGIEVLQAITKGIAFLLNTPFKDLPLFQNVSIITRAKNNAEEISNFGKHIPVCLKNIVITKADRQELINSDPNRTFDELEFQVGQSWKFKSHQFRRSLAFFGANSNLISESTGAVLFKHLNNEMQRYYRKGFNKIISVLGYLNKETGKIELPKDHFMIEFQTGISIEQAREIINLLFKDNDILYGKKGSYIDRQRVDLKGDETKILKEKISTQRKVLQGELSYKKTLLGGCMKNSRCTDYMLGNFTACIDCEDAVIEPNKLNHVVKTMESELTKYDAESGEYQFTKSELDKLIIFQTKEKVKLDYDK
jgi:hypothetical protein